MHFTTKQNNVQAYVNLTECLTGVKRNFWPVAVFQLFCFSEQKITSANSFFDVCCVN